MRLRARLLSLSLCCLSLATSASAQQGGPGVLPASRPAGAGGAVTGPILAADGTAAAPSYSFTNAATTGFSWGNPGVLVSQGGTATVLLTDGVQLRSAALLSWTSGLPTGTIDLSLSRDAANTLALRNGTNAQQFNLYRTYTDASNYARARLLFSGNDVLFGIQAAGSGVSGSIQFQTNATTRLTLSDSSLTTASTVGLGLAVPFAINTAPTIASGFGTSPSIPSSNGTAAFTINVGTGGTASSGVLTLPAATTGWVLQCVDITNAATAVTAQTAGTTTSATIANYARTTGILTAWAASDIIRCSASAY